MQSSNTIFYKGVTIHYTVTGKGQGVVLLHGFGETGEIWKNQIEFLSKSFKLIIPDIPGSGKSDYLLNADIETYAEILKNILDAVLNTENLITNTNTLSKKSNNTFSLIGHSMGGYIALAFAEKYPAYLNSLGLFHSSAFADTEEKRAMRKKAIEFISSKGAAAFLKSSIPTLFTGNFTDKNFKQVKQLINKGKNFSADALIQYYSAMSNRPDRRGILEKFDGPVLFIIGEWDTAVPLQQSLQQCHLPAKSYISILTLSAHMGLLEEAEKANKILFNFLSAI